MLLGDYEVAQSSFENALAFSREQGDTISFGTACINLSWVAATKGEWELAISRGEEGLEDKMDSRHTDAQAEALIWLGHAWLGLGQPEKASELYEESLRLRRDLGQEQLAMGVLAGLARAAQVKDDLETAGKYVEEIMSYLRDGSLDGTWEPLRIYLTCYQILLASQDDRAGDVLETSYQELQKRARKIPDGEARHIFLENVPWHREIIAIYQEKT